MALALARGRKERCMQQHSVTMQSTTEHTSLLEGTGAQCWLKSAGTPPSHSHVDSLVHLVLTPLVRGEGQWLFRQTGQQGIRELAPQKHVQPGLTSPMHSRWVHMLSRVLHDAPPTYLCPHTVKAVTPNPGNMHGPKAFSVDFLT